MGRSSLRKQLTSHDTFTNFPAKCMTSDKTSSEFPYWRRTLSRSGWYFFFPRDTTNQKHYPDLGSDTSSVWNFCACSPDVISQENHWWRREMSAFLGFRRSWCHFVTLDLHLSITVRNLALVNLPHLQQLPKKQTFWCDSGWVVGWFLASEIKSLHARGVDKILPIVCLYDALLNGAHLKSII